LNQNAILKKKIATNLSIIHFLDIKGLAYI